MIYSICPALSANSVTEDDLHRVSEDDVKIVFVGKGSIADHDAAPMIADLDASKMVADHDAAPMIVHLDASKMVADHDASPMVADHDAAPMVADLDASKMVADIDASPIKNEPLNVVSIVSCLEIMSCVMSCYGCCRYVMNIVGS